VIFSPLILWNHLEMGHCSWLVNHSTAIQTFRLPQFINPGSLIWGWPKDRS
jgi:hypothetical protein